MLVFIMKKNLVINFFGISVILLMITACETVDTTSYKGYKQTTTSTYYALACPSNNPSDNCEGGGLGPSNISQQDANQKALDECSKRYSDCLIVKEGDRTVYSKDDANRVQMATLIEDSKNTCKSLGFQQGTDKFTDCALKLYSQKLDLAKEQNQQVVVQNQGSSTVRVIDVTRERETTMRRSMGLINGTCTLATYYSC